MPVKAPKHWTRDSAGVFSRADGATVRLLRGPNTGQGVKIWRGYTRNGGPVLLSLSTDHVATYLEYASPWRTMAVLDIRHPLRVPTFDLPDSDNFVWSDASVHISCDTPSGTREVTVFTDDGHGNGVPLVVVPYDRLRDLAIAYAAERKGT